MEINDKYIEREDYMDKKDILQILNDLTLKLEDIGRSL